MDQEMVYNRMVLTVLGLFVVIVILIAILISLMDFFFGKKAPKAPRPPDCSRDGHAKRYLMLKQITLQKPWNCGGFHGPQDHPVGTVLWYMKWKCGRCPEFGMECRGNLGDWKIDHEQLLFDEKAFSNFEYPDPPKKPALEPGDLPEHELRRLEKVIADPGVNENCNAAMISMIAELRRRRPGAQS